MARPRRTFAGGTRRKTSWVGPADQGHVTVATNTSVIIASFDPQVQGLPQPTIVRTRGQISLVPDATSADVRIVGAYGLGVVSREAFVAGTAAIPDPFDEAGWDGWFVWRSFGMAWDFSDNTGARFSQMNQEVDSKAMRKVTDGEIVVFMASSQAGAYDIVMPLRMLVKLS